MIKTPLCLCLCLAAALSVGPSAATMAPAAREGIQRPAPRTSAGTTPLPRGIAGDPMAPWPTEEWSTASPESQGMDPTVLRQAFVYAARRDSKGVVVIRNGYVVGQWYGRGWDDSTRQLGWSMAKSFTSAIVGMLMADGAIHSVHDPVYHYAPQWDDSNHRPATLAHLLSMTSGIHWDSRSDGILLLRHPDKTRHALSQQMDRAPNTRWQYSNCGVQVLEEVVGNTAGVDAEVYAQEHLWGPIGMDSASWKRDDADNPWTFGGVVASTPDFAKFGYLYLRGGEWDGEQIVPTAWVAASTRPSQSLFPNYGYLWWLNRDRDRWPDVPADAYSAQGAKARRIYVIPSLDIVAVRLGAANNSWDDNTFLGQVSASVQN